MFWRDFFTDKLKNLRQLQRSERRFERVFGSPPGTYSGTYSEALYATSPEQWRDSLPAAAVEAQEPRPPREKLSPDEMPKTQSSPDKHNSQSQDTPLEEVSETEKSKTLKSLQEFAERSVSESGPQKDKAVRFDRGELRVKESVGKELTIKIQGVHKSQWETWIGEQSRDLPPSAKIVFVGDTFTEEAYEDLLGKMIKAMKLDEGEYARFPRAKDKQVAAGALLALKPEVVVTLGAGDTHLFLDAKERLSRVHGKFYDLKIIAENEECDLKLVPIFQPELLQINPNMKKTAWADMQKIMAHIGKLSS